MTVDVKARRRKLKALGRAGRGRRIPQELPVELTRAALELRASGRSWAEVGDDLGISYETARRYCEESKPGSLVPVHVVERTDELPLVLVSRGEMVEWWRDWDGEERDQAYICSKMLPQRTQMVRDLRLLTRGRRSRSIPCRRSATNCGGCHPKNPYCAGCPVAGRCGARLNEDYGFDVVALPRNDLDLLPRWVTDALGHDGLQ